MISFYFKVSWGIINYLKQRICMEYKKTKIDLLKTYLNHLLVMIIGVGGGSFSMMAKGRDDMLVNLGIISVVASIVVYAIIAININKTLKDMT